MKRPSARALALGLIVCALFVADGSLNPVRSEQTDASDVYVSEPVKPFTSAPAADLSRESPARRPIVTVPEGEPLPVGPPPARQPLYDPATQLEESGLLLDANELITGPIQNFPGLTAFANPPDTVLDVGPNHVVQMVNVTDFQVWDKNGNPLTGVVDFGSLWPPFDPCRSNSGDPIVVYDHLADRWLLSQFAVSGTPDYECIAISQTPDPTGAYHLYSFAVAAFPDYPKFGVWPDGYYMSTYEGSNLGVFVFDRANMLVGNPATYLKSTVPALGAPGVRSTRILPSDLDGPPPPAGTPNFFVRTVDGQQHLANPVDRIEIFQAAVNWSVPSFSFSLVNTLSPNSFQIMLCNRTGSGSLRDCIPQPGTTNTVDALSNRPMMQLKYRSFPTHAAMVFNQTIDVSGSLSGVIGYTPSQEVAGIRWYELRDQGAGWAIQQQGTYAPQPPGSPSENELQHRWMGSAAIDQFGNIALGYSISNSDNTNPIYPGIRYTGHRFDDPPGSMAQGEQIIRNGTEPELSTFRRWGDYSALSVDPVDDCTFWYTTHVARDIFGSGGRPTQIASFRFDNCGGTTPPNDLTIDNQILSTTQTFKACQTITVGPAVTVTPTANVTFQAGGSIAFQGVVSVQVGGLVAAVIDPLTCP